VTISLRYLAASLVWLGSLQTAALAQQTESETAPVFGKALEMPAQRALQRLREQPDTQLVPFTTDGCSGGLSDVWELVAGTFPDFEAIHEAHPPWESCCFVHDRAYHDAGPDTDAEASFDARLAADRALRVCVVETGDRRAAAEAAHYDISPLRVRQAYDTIAGAMFAAVRFGGVPCSTLSWRWGYGYPDCAWSTPSPDARQD